LDESKQTEARFKPEGSRLVVYMFSTSHLSSPWYYC
jgi:hypothetical protein